MEDTIAAISTALGVGAISIIRVSGDEAIDIVNKIFDKNLKKVKSHTINYGHIVDSNNIIDEVLVSVMRAPKTYTGEDVVEINCHGGISTTNKVLELVLNAGARLAEPGEFSKKAFLNGRIDLTQAEGIMNLIEAKTDTSRELSINQLNGNASKLIIDLRSALIDIISNIEVNIDYPEYEDIEVLTNESILPKVTKLSKELSEIISNAEQGQIINKGINIGIIGRPNVGKSSLLNSLLGENKAIVTDIEGTTRDIVEGNIIIKGIECHFIDTAGIRETEDKVEKIGVNKSIEIVDKSDLIILMLNNNEELNKEEKELLNKIKSKKHIIVINKVDLNTKIKLDENNVIYMSIKENKGIEELKQEIVKMFNLEEINTKDMTYLSNARSISLLKESEKILKNAIKSIEDGMSIDIVEFDLKNCWNKLGEIIGETYTDELINEIFSRFCLGK